MKSPKIKKTKATAKVKKPEYNAIHSAPLNNIDQLLPTLSFFTGIGGLDKGAKKAGFTSLFQTDIMKAAGDSFLLNRNNENEHLRSEGVFAVGDTAGNIHNLSFDSISGLVNEHLKYKIKTGEIAVIHGGPPCQDFSKCNNKRRACSKKNRLIFELLRIIREFKPKVGLIEQVRDLLGWRFFSVWSEVKVTLNTMTDYYWDYRIMDASEYGARQKRERMIIMLVRKDLGVPVSFPAPTQADLNKVAVGKLLPHIHFFSPGQYGDDIKTAEDNIFCTMTASGSEKAYEIDGMKRDFTIPERLVLTELEGHLLNGISKTSAKRLMGNMVQISLAEHLFKHIREHIIINTTQEELSWAA